MRQTQLIYTSRPFGYDATTLNDILFQARRNNKRDGITGALICRDDIFLQLLEGQGAEVTAAFARILRDQRHDEVELLSVTDVDTRLFPQWEMRHDPVRTWMWTPDQVHAGAVRKASVNELRQVFARIAKEPPEEFGGVV